MSVSWTSCKNTDCQAQVPLTEQNCSACGTPSGSTNVKIAEAQRAQLYARANEARQLAEKQSLGDELRVLESAATRTHAVVNTSVAMIHHLLTQERSLYAPYARQLAAKVRLPADLPNDRNRQAVERKLYGNAGDEIVYGALSLDGSGLVSYGPVAIALKELLIKNRTTALEENSFAFMQRHQVQVVGDVPEGYLGTWEDRTHVAVAKLAGTLNSGVTDQDVSSLLLRSTGDRKSDDFIEVHIWGGFNAITIDAIGVAQTAMDPEEEHILALAKHSATAKTIEWSTESP